MSSPLEKLGETSLKFLSKESVQKHKQRKSLSYKYEGKDVTCLSSHHTHPKAAALDHFDHQAGNRAYWILVWSRLAALILHKDKLVLIELNQWTLTAAEEQCALLQPDTSANSFRVNRSKNGTKYSESSVSSLQ